MQIEEQFVTYLVFENSPLDPIWKIKCLIYKQVILGYFVVVENLAICSSQLKNKKSSSDILGLF